MEYKNAILVLAIAAFVIPLMYRLKISPVIGYLLGGAIFGPFGLGKLAQHFPQLHYITIQNSENIEHLAELGIVFLLFLIGLELSPQRLLTMQRLVFGLGSLQVIVSTFVIGFCGILLGISPLAAGLIAFSLALSSTAIVVDILAKNNKMLSKTGRVSFSVLIFQDLAVIPLLFYIGTLNQKGEENPWIGLFYALLAAFGVLLAIVIVGKKILTPLFRQVTLTKRPEVFMAASLLVVLGTGGIAASAGLSMAIGGFVAGLLLAETEFIKALETLLEPFKGLLLGVFFITVGMKLDLLFLMTNLHSLLALALGLMVLKALVFYGLARLFSVPRLVALDSAFLLSSGGEFAFVTLTLLAVSGIFGEGLNKYLITVIALSMLIMPFIVAFTNKITAKMRKNEMKEQLSELEPVGNIKARALVVGAGRMGSLVGDMLFSHKISYVTTDFNVHVVAQMRKMQREAYFGNAKDIHFLQACGLKSCESLIITITDPKAIDEIVIMVREIYPQLPILARASDLSHAKRLYALGVSVAVPENLEASLQLSEATLSQLGQPMGKIIASIHQKRDDYRDLLRQNVR